MTIPKELLTMAHGYGFELARQKRHLVFKHPTGPVVVTAQSPSDHRALKNIDKEFRKALGL
jgi:predicted RNA binding protein YcfA (HicA-like mRNA interferase family)